MDLIINIKAFHANPAFNPTGTLNFDEHNTPWKYGISD